jgi:hypothetical protein
MSRVNWYSPPTPTQQALTTGPGASMLPTTQWNSVYTPYSIGGGSTSMYQTQTGGAQPSDVLNAMTSDQQKSQNQIDQMTALRGKTGDQTQQFSSGQMGQETKKQAQGLADVQNQRTDTQTAQGRQDVANSAAIAAQLGPNAAARGAGQIGQAQALRTSALDDLEQKKQTTLSQFSDNTALTTQNQRFAVMGQLAQQKQQTLDQLGQQGFAADSPQAQAAIQQLNAGASQQIGQLAGQASMAYNTQRSNLNTAYDSLTAQLRSTEDSLVGQATTEANKFTGLSEQSGAQLQMQGSQLSQAYSQMNLAQHAATDQQLTQVGLAADQLQLNGDNTLANLVDNWEIDVAPTAGIWALAADLTNGGAANIAGDIAAVNSNLGVQGPTLYAGSSVGGSEYNPAGVASPRDSAPYTSPEPTGDMGPNASLYYS